MTTTTASLSLFSFLRTSRKCNCLKRSPYKRKRGNLRLRTDRSQVQVGWSLPPVCPTALSAGFIFSRRWLVFYNVSGPKRPENKQHKATIFVENLNAWMWRQTVFLSGYRATKELCSAVSAYLSAAIQLGSVGTHGLQTAPRVSRRRWTRCVKFSWGESPLYNQHGCAAACTLSLRI